MTDAASDPDREDPRSEEAGHSDRAAPPPGREIGGALVKVLTDTAFAVVGIAATVVDKAQQFYAEQREQARIAGDERSAEYIVFVQAPDQMQKMATDLAKGYQDMAEKGRQRVLRTQAELEADLSDSRPEKAQLSQPGDRGEGEKGDSDSNLT